MMIWQLLHVRHLRETPLVFAGHMWQGLVDWASTGMPRPGFELASPEDMQIPVCVENAGAGGSPHPRASRALDGGAGEERVSRNLAGRPLSRVS